MKGNKVYKMFNLESIANISINPLSFFFLCFETGSWLTWNLICRSGCPHKDLPGSCSQMLELKINTTMPGL